MLCPMAYTTACLKNRYQSPRVLSASTRSPSAACRPKLAEGARVPTSRSTRTWSPRLPLQASIPVPRSPRSQVPTAAEVRRALGHSRAKVRRALVLLSRPGHTSHQTTQRPKTQISPKPRDPRILDFPSLDKTIKRRPAPITRPSGSHTSTDSSRQFAHMSHAIPPNQNDMPTTYRSQDFQFPPTYRTNPIYPSQSSVIPYRIAWLAIQPSGTLHKPFSYPVQVHVNHSRRHPPSRYRLKALSSHASQSPINPHTIAVPYSTYKHTDRPSHPPHTAPYTLQTMTHMQRHANDRRPMLAREQRLLNNRANCRSIAMQRLCNAVP
jgi:hypothetical protein